MSSANKEQKVMGNDTSESFNCKSVLQERPSNTNQQTYVAQIQQIMYALTRKKSEMRETKLQQNNLLGKSEQQEARIRDIKIAMDHAVDKEEIVRQNNQRIQEELTVQKVSIRDINIKIKDLKERIGQKSEQCTISKKNKKKIQQNCQQIDCLIKDKQRENQILDYKVQDMEMIIAGSQNQIRTKQYQISQQLVKKTELNSLLGFLTNKIQVTLKKRHNAVCQSNQFSKKTDKIEQKISNLRKEINQIQWTCQKDQMQNSQIEELNQRLKSDFQASQKHLINTQKSNTLLKNSLEEYGATGNRVTKIINSVRIH